MRSCAVRFLKKLFLWCGNTPENNCVTQYIDTKFSEQTIDHEYYERVVLGHHHVCMITSHRIMHVLAKCKAPVILDAVYRFADPDGLVAAVSHRDGTTFFSFREKMFEITDANTIALVDRLAKRYRTHFYKLQTPCDRPEEQ